MNDERGEEEEKKVKASRAHGLLYMSITCQKQYVRATIIFVALLGTSFFILNLIY